MCSEKGGAFIVVQEDNLINGVWEMFFLWSSSQVTAKSFSLLGIKKAETTNRFPQAWKKGESFGNHFYPLMKQLLIDVRFNKAFR
jgi:hypothetical protein